MTDHARLADLLATNHPARMARQHGPAAETFLTELTEWVRGLDTPSSSQAKLRDVRDENLHGQRVSVLLHGGDCYRGVLHRTSVGWRIGDPVNGPGAAFYDDAVTRFDAAAPDAIAGHRVADLPDVPHIPALDA